MSRKDRQYKRESIYKLIITAVECKIITKDAFYENDKYLIIQQYLRLDPRYWGGAVSVVVLEHVLTSWETKANILW